MTSALNLRALSAILGRFLVRFGQFGLILARIFVYVQRFCQYLSQFGAITATFENIEKTLFFAVYPGSVWSELWGKVDPIFEELFARFPDDFGVN